MIVCGYEMESEMNSGFGNRFGAQPQRRRQAGRPRVSNKNVAIWIALGLLYFFYMPIAILLFVGMYYFGKIAVKFQWRQYLMPALALLACASLASLPHAYMALRVTTFILFILYICRRFSFRMK